MQRRRWYVRAAILGAGLVTALGLAAPASADVVVTPGEAAQGGAADLTFRITNDSKTASVTAIEVQLPSDTPIAEVYPVSVPDWAPAMTNVKIDKPVASLHGYQITDVTTAVKWVAMPDKALAPGGTTELYLSIGPLPAVAQVPFGVVLTNSDGSQVRWTAVNGTPGDHPAPVLVLTAAAGGQGGHAAEHGGAATDAPAAAGADPGNGDGPASGGTSYLGWSLFALLLIAAICVFSVVRDRRRSTAPTSEPEAPAEDQEMASAQS
jgi:uncharacterized protein YcnI